ncbi:hypothetical protein [Tropheryma whipplei]|uniref:hypothetical protein n=1 Tax=Tropheryma whipplei TaxID=2039 RepID=UPI0004BA7190|nr:hypothetical protein [Tropheryma whipplei]
MPSISGTEVNGKFLYPTDVLTKGGTGYSKHTTTKPMTVIYTTGRGQSLPSGLTLNTSTARNASTSFPVKAIPNYYDYPGDFKNKLSHQVTLWNYTAAGNGVPSIHAVTSYLPNGSDTFVYPTNALTTGGTGYSSQENKYQ